MWAPILGSLRAEDSVRLHIQSRGRTYSPGPEVRDLGLCLISFDNKESTSHSKSET